MRNWDIIIITVITISGLVLVGDLGFRRPVGDKKRGDIMATQNVKTRSAVFAGGCFWCTESDFEKITGVLEAISGYTGGEVPHPTYEQVSRGHTGHVEAIKVLYDPEQISYRELLGVFWRHIDPTDAGGQFVDRGSQYRSVIFYGDEKERALAEDSKKQLQESGLFGRPIVTEILPLGPFYPAEDYHQDYYQKCPLPYQRYRQGSGRERFLERIWKKASDDTKRKISVLSDSKEKDKAIDKIQLAEEQREKIKRQGLPNHSTDAISEEKEGTIYHDLPGDQELQEKLTPRQYNVTRENGTEPPFNNQYWNHHEPGIYVDIVSGEPLFSSRDKFDSGTGWPSFTRPLEPENIVTRTDRSLFLVRTEIRSRHADSHLGHLFNDGPAPTGQRYCINSAALRFIPLKDLEKEGYGKYLKILD